MLSSEFLSSNYFQIVQHVVLSHLIIIPQVCTGYDLAIIISYPTSASGIIVLLKTPTKYREFFQTLFVKTTDSQLVFNFEQMCTVTIIFGDCRSYNGSYHDG